MKIASLILSMILFLSSCATQPCIMEQAENPSVVISGHYSETLNNDSDTMRKAAEIEAAINREMCICE